MEGPSANRRDWTDWTGFIFWMSWGLWLLYRAHNVALLLLPTILYELLAGFSFLLRSRRKARLDGILPRLTAYGATFIIPAFVFYVRSLHPDWLVRVGPMPLATVGSALWFGGALLAIWAAWHLRYAFGLEPQARKLVVAGPYRLARHPIYASYLLQYSGICLIFGRAPWLLVSLAWFSLVMVRIHYEEKVLSATFPQYVSYRATVGMFGPKVFPQVPRQRSQPAAGIASTCDSLGIGVTAGGAQ